MAGKLTSTVTVADEGGVFHTFGPDDDLPGWARKAITNPKAYGETVIDGPANHGLSAPDREELAEAAAKAPKAEPAKN